MYQSALEQIVRSVNLFSKEIKIRITPFTSAEDGEEYSVWAVSSDEGECVLKKAKGDELSIYQSYLCNVESVPRLLDHVRHENEDYILLERIHGEPLFKMTRGKIQSALDALISIQDRYWQATERSAGLSFEKSLARRAERGTHLLNADLEAEYKRFIECYQTLPRTLCHDDLLPFNVMVSADEKATILDWEVAGMLPYPTSLARLLAHAEESEDAFFFIKDADKEFAVSYYYDSFIKGKGIPFAEYKRAVDLFIFYEYCEWIMLGNKYANADMTRFEAYMKKAKNHLELMKRGNR